MGFFSKNTKQEALCQIEKINQEMRAISASMHLNYNMIDGRNRNEVRRHYNNIVGYVSKYKRIKGSFPMLEQLELEAEKIMLWNGKEADITTWEFYLFPLLEEIYKEVNY